MQGRAGQGRAGQGRAGQGRAGQWWEVEKMTAIVMKFPLKNGML